MSFTSPLIRSAITLAFSSGLAFTQTYLYAADADSQVKNANTVKEQDKHDQASLPELAVTSSKTKVVGYNPLESRGATRTDTPLREVPQSVRVVSREWLDDTRALRLADTVDYVSGISRLNDFGATWDNFAIRGFSNTDQGILINGFRGSRGYNVTRDAATVERFEFLKGPAAAVYGASEPGGIINVVTKKPQFTQHNSLDVNIGSYGLRRAALDTTGPITDNLAYRLNVVAEDSAMRSSLLEGDRQVFTPALTWILSDKTVLNYEAEFARVSTPLDRGLIQINGRAGALSRSRVLGEPNDGNVELTSQTHQLTLEHEFSDAWRGRAGLSFKKGSYEGDNTELATFNPSVVNRRQMWRSLPMRDTSFQAELEGKLKTGAIDHTLLVGVEASRLWMAQEITRSNPSISPYALDIYNPVYGQAKPASQDWWFDTNEHQKNNAVYLQDQIGLSSQWKLLVGVRADNYHQEYEDSLAQANTSRQRQTATSPRVGLTYLPSDWASLYISFSEGFRPNSGGSATGKAFDPQSSRATEFGLKLQTVDQRLGANFAIFDITKRNVLVTDPANANRSIAAGEAESRGFEADVFGKLNEHWRLTANFAYTDAEVSKDSNVSLVGARLANVPKTSAGLLAIREGFLPNGSRYGVGTGIVYVGNRAGNATNTYDLPSYTTVKLLSYWDATPKARFSLDVSNLFDREYYTSSWNNYVMPGLGRSVLASLHLQF
ncbi:TonB-dependent siderophore receptor [Methylobacillus gramineus]|uniref:TonB-dependent siderophore receptor n=1 Tax=Methylobacillus gramineus TaxID=755169 RepID=UPI001CFFD088|nr:TonB-dependent siderophore receptor [Methylobacillus gramineus]MCB5186284.1 TonB-dependent siderophore receptor [Methylobacillus gramineus]